ncbi:methyltransferase domain-containing protein [Amycolatopsis silviterrae]|uniref:Methyltransferase domain-containing protein n=1 Tax=Amycolatopsis silviterrae TaxID=1656914 RepID=A0ABW5HGZ2_9PSEU
MTLDDRTRARPGEFAPEIAATQAFLGPLRGRTLLDLGCADPGIARIAARGGVRGYHGLAPAGQLPAASAAAAPGTVELFDPDRWSGRGSARYELVAAARILQHVRNLARLLETLHHLVSPGGRLVFSVDHPFARAGNYFDEDEDAGAPAWCGLPRRHRTFSGYVRELSYCGFRVVELAEGVRAGDDPSSGTPRWTVFRCVRTP